jgi:hypothetical protein
MNIKKYTRKNFFSTVGKGSLYTFLAAVLPIKLFASVKNSDKIKIQIHPNAVKRNNKV